MICHLILSPRIWNINTQANNCYPETKHKKYMGKNITCKNRCDCDNNLMGIFLEVNVNRMPRNRLSRIMKRYSPTGRRNHGRPLKRLLDT
jgi:hypothetical protein